MLATRDYDLVASTAKEAGKSIKLIDLEGNQPELVILDPSEKAEASKTVASIS